MAFCGKCGKQIDAGVKFCPGCGAPIEAPAGEANAASGAAAGGNGGQQTGQKQDFTDKLTSLNNTKDTTKDYDQKDIADNKTMAILAYIGPLVLIPIFAAKESKYARYHSNQGLILLLAEIAFGIAYAIITAILLAISWRLVFLTSIIGLLGLVFLAWLIIGILNVTKGLAKELPIIGKFTLLK